jgi:Flp pilus assembly protein TadD
LRNNLGLSLAFAGHYKGAIEILRPLALRPGASARDRQNLALAYGLSGDVDQAKKFARMDMDSREVERNLSYYAALRSIADPVMRVKSVRAGYALQVP